MKGQAEYAILVIIGVIGALIFNAGILPAFSGGSPDTLLVFVGVILMGTAIGTGSLILKGGH